MAQKDFQQIRNILMKLGNMEVSAEQHRIGLAQFGQTTKVEFLLNAHQTKEQTVNALRRFRVRPNGPRNLGSALDFARTQFFNKSAGGRANQGYRQFLVVLTGGLSNDPVIGASRLVRAEGVSIVAVSTDPNSVTELNSFRPYVYMSQDTNIVFTLRKLFEKEDEIVMSAGEGLKNNLTTKPIFLSDLMVTHWYSPILILIPSNLCKMYVFIIWW